METIKTSKGSFLFVEVDKSGIGFICDMGYLIYTGRSGRRMYVKLPEGEYKFIGKSYDMVEWQAAQIVGDNGAGCWDNYRLKKDEVYTCKTAMDSFNCLMLFTPHLLKVDSNYAILKVL